MRRGANVSRPCLQPMVQRNMAFPAFSLLSLSSPCWGCNVVPPLLCNQRVGNWHSEVCLGFDLSPGDPPGHLTHSQSVLFIDDSRINTFQAER